MPRLKPAETVFPQNAERKTGIAGTAKLSWGDRLNLNEKNLNQKFHQQSNIIN
ncbi:hypothetical protein [Trichocoleus sp. FACHB-46]|uniref:Uncharacterized protein n=1 Tax=Trichocoleus desertorum GB2-A4 TaxID=2933944 RepID=A0ABV0JA19_9CYAN|nr:hypothetical protein [Trichocoleus sp. FACHB-46]